MSHPLRVLSGPKAKVYSNYVKPSYTVYKYLVYDVSSIPLYRSPIVSTPRTLRTGVTPKIGNPCDSLYSYWPYVECHTTLFDDSPCLHLSLIQTHTSTLFHPCTLLSLESGVPSPVTHSYDGPICLGGISTERVNIWFPLLRGAQDVSIQHFQLT